MPQKNNNVQNANAKDSMNATNENLAKPHANKTYANENENLKVSSVKDSANSINENLAKTHFIKSHATPPPLRPKRL